MALIAALGTAAEIAERDNEQRRQACKTFRDKALAALVQLEPRLTGDLSLHLQQLHPKSCLESDGDERR